MILKSLVDKELSAIEKWVSNQQGYNHKTSEAWPHIEILLKMVRELVDRVNELEGFKK